MEKIQTTAPDGQSTRVMATKQRPAVGYVFMLSPKEPDEDYKTIEPDAR
ncbi:MAG: hypothetical protein WDO69_04300 [Pseudomonadota bacterium]